jgi:hypothetical protein|nr:VIT domain-containing protein [Kofleriaceae bacterium]
MRKVLWLFAACVACRGMSESSFGGFAHGEHDGDAAAFRLLAPPLHRVASPVQLATSDGSELALARLDVTVTFDGPLAHTELHYRFHNPENRQREGRFSIALPPGVALGRFAMLQSDGWLEARVVARDRGRAVYESYLKRRVDPALLEQDAGNTFSARVFPIAANADKELIVGYDEPIAGDYRLPLRGLPSVPVLAVTVVRGDQRATTERRDVRPDDLVISADRGDHAVVSAKDAAGDPVFVARLDVPSVRAPEPMARVAIAVDTSASRLGVLREQADLVRSLVASLPSDAQIAIVTYDQGVEPVWQGRVEDWEPKLADRIVDHGALGASDLGAALDWAASSGMARVVIVGDGTPTLGEREPAKLAQRLAGAATPATIERVDAIQVGDAIDRDTLGPIVAAGARPGAILDSRHGDQLAHQLATALAPAQPIRVDGATSWWPQTTAGLAPGDPVWVAGFGALGAVHVGGYATHVAAEQGDASRLVKAVARAHVAALTVDRGKPEADRAAIDAQIEQVALAAQIASSRTSLIVLDTAAAEQATFGPAQAPGAPGAQPAQVAQAAPPANPGTGETISVSAKAPVIDPTSTTQGITLDKNYLRNIPVPGRTFEAALGAAAGSESDSAGVSFSGASSLENQYYVDGVDMDSASDLDPVYVVQKMVDNDVQATQQASAPPPPPPQQVSAGHGKSPYAGPFADVMTALAHHDREHALELAARAHADQPGDVTALLALGEAFEARGESALAARAYGSIVDLYPSRAELARAAGERLSRVPGQLAATIDAYRRALHERPDQASTYRLLAYALYRDHRPDEAADVLRAGIDHAQRPSIQQMLREDLAIVRGELAPGLRIILSWETDANDVDLHVTDGRGDESWYSHPAIASGGALRDDITTGYGPEMFEVAKPRAFPYAIQVHYFSRGAMGVGLGMVEVVTGSAPGDVTIEDRPFALQIDDARVDLGMVSKVR